MHPGPTPSPCSARLRRALVVPQPVLEQGIGPGCACTCLHATK